MDRPECPFCHLKKKSCIQLENDGAAAFLDAFPVAPGDMPAVPKRHGALWRLVTLVRGKLMSSWLDHQGAELWP
jgi:diadenosine tetraphosphate (Ap4A) HIT family hydrolase